MENTATSEDTQNETSTNTGKEEDSGSHIPSNSKRETLSDKKDDDSGSEKVDSKVDDSVESNKSDEPASIEESSKPKSGEGAQLSAGVGSASKGIAPCPDDSEAVKEPCEFSEKVSENNPQSVLEERSKDVSEAVKEPCEFSEKVSENNPQSVLEERSKDVEVSKSSQRDAIELLEDNEGETASSVKFTDVRNEQECKDSRVPDCSQSDSVKPVNEDVSKTVIDKFVEVDSETLAEEIVTKTDASFGISDDDKSVKDKSIEDESAEPKSDKDANHKDGSDKDKSNKDESRKGESDKDESDKDSDKHESDLLESDKHDSDEEGSNTETVKDCDGSAIELSDITQSDSNYEEQLSAVSKAEDKGPTTSTSDGKESSTAAPNVSDDSDPQRDSNSEQLPSSSENRNYKESGNELEQGPVEDTSECNPPGKISDPVKENSVKIDNTEAMEVESENASASLLLKNVSSGTIDPSAEEPMEVDTPEPPVSVDSSVLEKCVQGISDTDISSVEATMTSEREQTGGTEKVGDKDDVAGSVSPASDLNTMELDEPSVEKSQLVKPSDEQESHNMEEKESVPIEIESKVSGDNLAFQTDKEVICEDDKKVSKTVSDLEQVCEDTSPLKTSEDTDTNSQLDSKSEVETAVTTPICEEDCQSIDTDCGKDVEALARADVDNACEEESIDSTDHNDESDPFCSLNEKGKDTESQLDQEDSQRDDPVKDGPESIIRNQQEGSQIEKEEKDQSLKIQHQKETVSKSPSDTIEGESVSCSTEGGNEAEEDLCIVPDTEPRIPTDREKAEAVEKASKATQDVGESSVETVQEKTQAASVCGKDSSNVAESPDSSESNTVTPPAQKTTTSKEVVVSSPSRRPQRQAAQRADAQIKVCLAAVARDKDDDVDIKDKVDQSCAECGTVTNCKYKVQVANSTKHLCKEDCFNEYKKKNDNTGRTSPPTTSLGKARELERSFVRKCGQCKMEINISDDKVLTWETMDFCHDECLGKYQTDLGSHCANCKGAVQSQSLGKYCVRFGYDIKQFCCASCLEEFKKGLKVCSYCQKDISSGSEGFLAPVGDKGQFKDFCTQACMEKYDQMSNNTAPPQITHECAVCNNEKVVKVEVVLDTKVQKLCSEPCFAAFKFVNAIVADQCDMCKKYFDKGKTDNFTVFYDDAPHSFCCKTCMNVYILAKRKIVPCSWCKVKKYNFDMIKKITSSGQVVMMCSLNCLSLYQVSINAVSSRRIKCDMCGTNSQAQYHLTMSDATIRNFCCYSCVMNFQGQYTKSPITLPGSEQAPHPTGGPKKTIPRRSLPVGEKDLGSKNTSMPVISSVTSLAPANGQPPSTVNSGTSTAMKAGPNETVRPLYKQQLIIKPPVPPERQNRAVQVKPIMHTKGVSCRPHPCTKETQTEENAGKPTLIPIPVPIFIPVPMHMYASPYPVPIPFPLPIPVPIFIPTTRNSAKGIFKEIKRIQEKIPTDPFEAELLMMAEMVAGEKKAENTDTESENGDNVADDPVPVASSEEPDFTPEAVDTSNTFGDDMLQMALKMASELDEPAVDFEAAVAPATISQSAPTSQIDHNEAESEVDETEGDGRTRAGRKRPIRAPPRPPSVAPKRGRRISGSDSMAIIPTPEPATARIEPVEKPDAKMCLKFTFGVNAWRHWVSQKNAELEKAASNTRKMKLFKPEILQLTADELNYSLCLFVKEVRKPNGSEYAPDTIYYLCLGIQQYLIENGRVENIFCDPYYEKFTDCLDEVAKKFSVLYNDAQYVVTRVEEEHLWESKQLGAHSPHVLLSTLMFFNTKHFNLTTVDEHMQLSFSHIMKHWKRNPTSPGAPKLPGSRNVLLRFYPPQSTLAANSRKKKVYEQQENEDNPLRCPVKLYEFYLLKCPESVKTRNDVFYLLPERSCVPDSPVWYSTMALGKEQLQKMLHRIKMVKEINIALLGS